MKDAWILLEWLFWLAIVLLLDPPTIRRLGRKRRK